MIETLFRTRNRFITVDHQKAMLSPSAERGEHVSLKINEMYHGGRGARFSSTIIVCFY